MFFFAERGYFMEQNTFSYEAKGNTLVIHLPRELDHHNCRNLRYETDLLLAENYISRIVFDFSQTEFMDSSGIGVIMGRCKKARALGGKVIIYGASDAVKRIIKMSGIDGIVVVADTVERGIKEAALNV